MSVCADRISHYSFPGFPKPYDSHPSLLRNGSFTKGASSSVIDPVTGLVQTGGLLPSSSNTYGALGIGISESGGSKADGSEKKKKVSAAELSLVFIVTCAVADSVSISRNRELRRANSCAEIAAQWTRPNGARYVKKASSATDMVSFPDYALCSGPGRAKVAL